MPTPKQVFPSDGERRALLGFYPQYRLCAKLVYGALQKGEFEWVELMSRDADAIDDVVIGTHDRVDALQLKHSSAPQSITLASLFRTATKQPRSLLRSLADGWRGLSTAHPGKVINARLVFRGIPTSIGNLDPTIIPQDGSFHDFLQEGWEALLDSFGATKWRNVRAAIVREAQLTEANIAAFFAECAIDFLDANAAVEHRWAETDIRELTEFLQRMAAADIRPGRMDRDSLLHGLGWSSRFQYHFAHEWKIDERYQSIHATIDPLRTLLEKTHSGYIALLGTPGSGKSTTLSHTLRHLGGWRFIPYYSYLPGDNAQGRGEAVQFVHDLVVAIHRLGIRGTRGYAPDDLSGLQQELSAIFVQLGDDFQKSGRRTVILVDGLDHIQREQTPATSLLTVLPHPDSIPRGVLIVLGSQTLELKQLSPAILTAIGNDLKIQMAPMSKGEVLEFVRQSRLRAPPNAEHQEEIYRLSEGHPLALALLVERLRRASDLIEFNQIMANSPPYDGHIEKSYAVFWYGLSRQREIRSMLARWVRLRVAYTGAELAEVFGSNATEDTIAATHPFLKIGGTGVVDFFHNSFRQYVLAQTRSSLLRVDENATIHAELANRFAELPPASAPRWEALFHASTAGDELLSLKLGSIERWREDFLSGRPLDGIFEDIRRCIRIAKQRTDVDSVIGLLLVWQEFYARSRALEFEDRTLLVYRLFGAVAARRHIESGGWLRLSSRRAWDFCTALLNAGEKVHAREIYDLAEPIAILSGQDEITVGWRDESGHDYAAWAKVAVHFRPLTEILAGISHLRTRPRNSNQLGGLSTGELRMSALVALAEEFIDRDDSLSLEVIREQVDESMRVRWQRSLDWHVLNHNPKHREAAAALERIESHAETHVEKAAEVSEMIWRVTGDRSRARIWIMRASQPASPLESGALGNGEDIRQRLLITRMRVATGEALDIDVIVPPIGSAHHYGYWLYDRALTKLAILWGKARAGVTPELTEFRREIQPLLKLFHHHHEETREWGGWYSGTQRQEEFFEFLVNAVAAYGTGALAILSDEIDLIWKEPSNRGAFWPTSLRRVVAKNLHRHDGIRENLVRRIQDTVSDAHVLDDSLDSRIQEYADLADAWLAAGEIERAKITYFQMMATAFGIPEKGGFNIGECYRWWRRSFEANPEQFKDAEKIGSMLERFSRARRGEDVDETALQFVETLGERDCITEHRFARFFHDSGVITFSEALAQDLLSVLRNRPEHRSGVAILIENLLIPFARETCDKLASIFAETVEKHEDQRVYSVRIIHALDTKALPDMREEWMKTFSAKSNKQPDDDTMDEEELSEDDYSKRQRQKLSSEKSRWELLSTFDEISSFLNEIEGGGKDLFRLGAITDDFLLRLPKRDWSGFAQMASASNWSPFALTYFAHIYRKHGLVSDGAAIAKRGFQNAESTGWWKYYDGGSKILPAEEWVNCDPNARLTVFQSWVDDYLVGEAHAPESLESLADLFRLFSAKPAWDKIWPAIHEQALTLAECREHPLTPVPETQEASVSAIIEYWFAWCASLPAFELFEGMYRSLKQFAGDPVCHHLVFPIIRRFLTQNQETQIVVLYFLGMNQHLAKSAPLDVQDTVAGLAADPSGIVRGYASMAIKWMSVKPKLPVPPDERDMAAYYDLQLPPAPTITPSWTNEMYPRGEPPLDTEDRYEWMSVVSDHLDRLAELSNIPLQNLIQRTAQLMQETPRETWSAEAEQKILNRMAKSELRLTYRHLRAGVATAAFARLLTELNDAGRITDYLFSSFASVIDPVEFAIESWSVQRMPTEVTFPSIIKLRQLETEPWIKTPAESLPLCVRRLDDGRVVLAELSRFRFWDRSRPTEIRSSNGVRVGKLPPRWHGDDGFIHLGSQYWKADRYYRLPVSKDVSEIAFSGSSMAVLGRDDWVAFAPSAARAMSWRPAQSGKFGWQNEAGDLQVETIWWSNGPFHRVEVVQRSFSGEGWLVVATPSAALALVKKFGLVRHVGVSRSTSSDRESAPIFASETEAY